MPFALSWILFGMPLIALIVSWVGLCAAWPTEGHRISKVSALILPTAAALLACGALAYVRSGGKIAPFDYRVEFVGLLFSLSGTVIGLIAALRFPRWFSTLASGTSLWMLVLFFLAASTY
ncbi:MAG: hypothetical protein WB683_18065 [Candidatus Sulfotelmatobacter sp.]